MKGVHLAEAEKQKPKATKEAERALQRAEMQAKMLRAVQPARIAAGVPTVAEAAAKRAVNAAMGTVRQAERVDESLGLGIFHPETARVTLPSGLVEERIQLEKVRVQAVHGDVPKQEFEKLRRHYAHGLAVFLAGEAERRISDPVENLRRELGSIREVAVGFRREMRDGGLVDMHAPERSDGNWLYRKLGAIVHDIDALRDETGKAKPGSLPDELAARLQKLYVEYRQAVNVIYHPAKLLLAELKKNGGLVAYLRESEGSDHSLSKVSALEDLERARGHLMEALRIMQYAPERMADARKEFRAAAEDRTQALTRLYINENSIADNVRLAAGMTYDPTARFAFYRDALVALYDASAHGKGFDKNFAALGAALLHLETCMVTSDKKLFASGEAKLQQGVIANSEKLVADYSSLLSGGKAALTEKDAAAISAAVKSDSSILYARIRRARRIDQLAELGMSLIPVIGSAFITASVIKGAARDYATTGEISPMTGVMAATAVLGLRGGLAKEAFAAIEQSLLLRLSEFGAAGALTVPQARHVAESWAAYRVAPKQERRERQDALEEAIFSSLSLAVPVLGGAVHAKAAKFMESRGEIAMPVKARPKNPAKSGPKMPPQSEALRLRIAMADMARAVVKGAEGLPFGITAEKVAAVNRLRAQITPLAEAKFARGQQLTQVEMAALIAKESETLGLPKKGQWRNEDLGAIKVLMAETERLEAKDAARRQRSVPMAEAPVAAERTRAAPAEASALVAGSLSGDGSALAMNVAVLTAQPTVAGKTLHETVLANGEALHSAVERMRGNIETAAPVLRSLDNAARAAESWAFRTFRRANPLAREDYARIVVSIDKGKTWLLNSLSDRGEYGDLGLVVFFRGASKAVKDLGIEGVSIVRTGADDATIVISELGFRRLGERFGAKTENDAIGIVIGRVRAEARTAAAQMGITSPQLIGALADFTGIGDALSRDRTNGEWMLASSGRRYRTMEAAVGAIESRSLVEKVRATDPVAAVRLEQAATAFDRNQVPKTKGVNRLNEAEGKPVDSSGAPVRIDEAVNFRVAFQEGMRTAFMRGAEAKGKGVTAVEKNLIGPSVTNSVAGSAFTDGLSAHYAAAFARAAAEAKLSGKMAIYETGPMAFGFSFNGPVGSDTMARVLGRSEQLFLQSVPGELGIKDVRTFRTATVREGRYRVADALFGEPAEAVSPQADMNAKRLVSAIHVADEGALRDYLSTNGVDRQTADAVIKARGEKWLRGIEDLRPALLKNGATGPGLDRLFRIYALPHRILARAAEPGPAPAVTPRKATAPGTRETYRQAFVRGYGQRRGIGGGIGMLGAGDADALYHGIEGGVAAVRELRIKRSAMKKAGGDREPAVRQAQAKKSESAGEARAVKADAETVFGQIAEAEGASSREDLLTEYGPDFVRKRLTELGYGNEDIRKALSQHSEAAYEHFARHVKGREDAGLKAAIGSGGRRSGKEYLAGQYYPESVAEAIVEGYPAELELHRQSVTRIPARPQRDLPRAALPLISSDETAQILTNGFGFKDIGSSKEHDLQRPKRDEKGKIIPGQYTGKIPIPRNRDAVALGTLDAILKESGITRRDFLQKALDLGILTRKQAREWGLEKSAAP